MKEKELLEKLKEVEKELKTVRNQVNSAREKLWRAEDQLITTKLQYDKLQEQLKYLRHNQTIDEDIVRDEDIKRFKKVFPEINDKLEKEDKK